MQTERGEKRKQRRGCSRTQEGESDRFFLLVVGRSWPLLIFDALLSVLSPFGGIQRQERHGSNQCAAIACLGRSAGACGVGSRCPRYDTTIHVSSYLSDFFNPSTLILAFSNALSNNYTHISISLSPFFCLEVSPFFSFTVSFCLDMSVKRRVSRSIGSLALTSSLSLSDLCVSVSRA